MTREKAIEILRKNRPTSDPRPCGMELCDAVDMAISALRKQEAVTNRNGLNEPLTLDELRKMNGELVWVEPNDSRPPHWRIWSNSEPFDMVEFKAYRRKPEEGTV